MAKSKKPKLTSSQKRYVKEVANLKKRVKRAEKSGFIFSEDIIPSLTNLPRRIGKAVIEAVKNIRAEKLYEKATGFISQEKKIPVSQGIELTKRKRIASWTANLPKKRKAISAQQYEDEQLADGIQLLAEYNSLSEEQKMDFIRSLSNEDYYAFTLAKIRHREAKNGRETGQYLLPDEGIESKEIPEAKEYYGEDTEPDGTEIIETEAVERKPFNEEITDEEVKKWRESYEKQKRLPKKEREYIYDGDAIYAGIVNRLKQFEDDYTRDKDRYAGAYSIYKKFVTMLENEIKISGFNTVMKRLDGKGIEIDTALEAMLYQDSEQARNGHPAFQQLAEIIMGRAMTQQESAELAAVSETWDFDTEDNPAYQIDR